MFANYTAPSVLLPSPAYNARQNIVRSRLESAPMSASASSRHRSISASLRTWRGCGLWLAWPRLRGLATNSTSRTQTDTEPFDTAEFVGDLLERQRLGAQLAGSLPFQVFTAVAHASIMTIGCGRDDQVEARIGRVGDSLPPAGSSVTPSTKPVGSTPSSRSSTEPSAAGRNRPADVAPSSPTSHS